MREHEPELWEQIRSVMLPKDYVRLRLCGERATDVTDASGTLLFDVANRAWSDELCDELGVPREWLPVALESPACQRAHRGRCARLPPAPVTRRPARSGSA